MRAVQDEEVPRALRSHRRLEREARAAFGHDGVIAKVDERKIFEQIRILDARNSAEEIDLLEMKRAMKELWKEMRSTEVEQCRDSFVGSGVTRMGAAGSRST